MCIALQCGNVNTTEKKPQQPRAQYKYNSDHITALHMHTNSQCGAHLATGKMRAVFATKCL